MPEIRPLMPWDVCWIGSLDLLVPGRSDLVMPDAITGVRLPDRDRGHDQLEVEPPTSGDDLASFLTRVPIDRPGGDRSSGDGR